MLILMRQPRCPFGGPRMSRKATRRPRGHILPLGETKSDRTSSMRSAIAFRVRRAQHKSCRIVAWQNSWPGARCCGAPTRLGTPLRGSTATTPPKPWRRFPFNSRDHPFTVLGLSSRPGMVLDGKSTRKNRLHCLLDANKVRDPHMRLALFNRTADYVVVAD